MTSNVSIESTHCSVPMPETTSEFTSYVPTDSETPAIPRSASYTQLPVTAHQEITLGTSGLKRNFSENALTNGDEPLERRSSLKQPLDEENKKTPFINGNKGLGRRKSARSKISPKVTVSKFTLAPDRIGDDHASLPNPEVKNATVNRESKVRSVSGSLSSFARKSWISASRSPSPSKRQPISGNEGAPDSSSLARSKSRSAVDKKGESRDGKTNGIVNPPSRRGTALGKKPRRPLSTFLGKALPEPDFDSSHPVPLIPKSFSTDRLPWLLQNQSQSQLGMTSASLRSMSSERLQGIGLESSRKKDELWNIFRALDGEFQKFQSKPSTLKTAVVRSALLPFLRNHAEHPSNKNLRPEDLDRRINILNKWWTGLLEMLNGRHGESVSGNDRPTILEAVTGLMVRPEWTLQALPIAAQPERSRQPSLKSRSTTSLVSTTSEFLASSVFHNVRNTFQQNLLAQMAFVVDKMSIRNVPASVVAFCGKATAYAFFYCEGVADMLVRLWAIPLKTLRRVVAENSDNQNVDLSSSSEKIACVFPLCTQSLTFKSLPLMMRSLRRRPQVPLGTAYIPWHGPWVGRWAGRDTDLFFVFAKYYHILACQFLPDELDGEERLCVPAYALIQAQILTVLDATIHRTGGQPVLEHFDASPAVTFDDILVDADASATALPLPPANVVRSMAENRLIMFLRDFLSGSPVVTEKAQNIFAETFGGLLKAAARQTSIFNHNACFTLCDFMEEAITILVRYRQTIDPTMPVVDWSFWLEVCGQMMESQNSMTDIRLCAFLYSLWGIITSDEDRKRVICVEWLLSEESFQRQFNHWCPMVRSYFMHILCWKIARLDGEGSDLDVTILETLSTRLKSTWCHYLYHQDCTERNGLMRPSTAPCCEAPGRRLLIVRNDMQPMPGRMFVSFDGILPASSPNQATAYERHGSLESLSQGSATHAVSNAEENRSLVGGKKRWGLFAKSNTSSTSSASSAANDAEYRKASKIASDKNRVKNMASEAPMSDVVRTVPQHRNHSFKFSLEWVDRSNNYCKDRRLYPPRLPLPAQMFLQSRRAEPHEFKPCKPEGVAVGPSKYAGRALAEWAIIVIECQNFFERRKAEGVPGNQWVETPTLGVESFRKPG